MQANTITRLAVITTALITTTLPSSAAAKPSLADAYSSLSESHSTVRRATDTYWKATTESSQKSDMSAFGADGIDVKSKSSKGYFNIKGAPVIYDPADFTVVAKVTEMLRSDLKALTGTFPQIYPNLTPAASGKKTDSKSSGNIVIGTLGHSHIIDSIASANLIPAEEIRGAKERFIIKTVKTADGRELLVIAGSDRRGTAYGVTTLSRALGVDPWVWWGDVPVKQNPEITVKADHISESPTIEYRGIFINDEDWGMYPWAAQGPDKDLKDIGPKAYERVCQLLLRLKGNMLAPAMHSCTGAFYSHPESKIVADDYAIFITTSHCEPMMFNNAARSEWDSSRDGKWDYKSNKDVIYNKFVNRLEEVADFDNIFTIGMRGVHDEAMSQDRSVEERVSILEDVITDQRNLLSKRLNKPIEEIPQIFVPYKETLDLYRKGLKVPDDVIIVWPDDNYGYMKSLSSPEEQTRKGRSGVYYHISYLGTPHDYLWICTTPPAFMYGELKKAYDFGADRYWLLNVGDIKPAELDIQTFFDMAWNLDSFNYGNINNYQAALVSSWCGEKYRDSLQEILDEYYRLAWIHKPEYMGWEIEWDTPESADIRPTEFSFTNYGDAWKRLDDYTSLADRTDKIMNELPDSLRTPFFEMIGYPVLASNMMNRKFLFAQLNGEQAAAGDKEGANYAARLSKEAADSIDSLTKTYNTLEDGKWNGMMTVPPGICARYQNRPKLTEYPDAGERTVKFSQPMASCTTLDLRKVKTTTGKGNKSGNGAVIIDGVGYDGYILKLGEAAALKNAEEAIATLELGNLSGDELSLSVFHLPYFPVYNGQRCRIGLSLDGGKEEVIEYLPEEWSAVWKENILRNSALSNVTFPVDSSRKNHTLQIRGIDPGMAIQRIVINDGGLKPGYVGPDL